METDRTAIAFAEPVVLAVFVVLVAFAESVSLLLCSVQETHFLMLTTKMCSIAGLHSDWFA